MSLSHFQSWCFLVELVFELYNTKNCYVGPELSVRFQATRMRRDSMRWLITVPEASVSVFHWALNE